MHRAVVILVKRNWQFILFFVTSNLKVSCAYTKTNILSFHRSKKNSLSHTFSLSTASQGAASLCGIATRCWFHTQWLPIEIRRVIASAGYGTQYGGKGALLSLSFLRLISVYNITLPCLNPKTWLSSLSDCIRIHSRFTTIHYFITFVLFCHFCVCTTLFTFLLPLPFLIRFCVPPHPPRYEYTNKRVPIFEQLVPS